MGLRKPQNCSYGSKKQVLVYQLLITEGVMSRSRHNVPGIGGERPTGQYFMTVRELVEEYNQFVEADEDKLWVGVAPVDVQVARWVTRMRRRLDALEKRLYEAANRYFAKAGK